MKRIYIYIVLASFLIISCQKLLFNEDSKTREIALENFHAVKILGIYNIVLIQDSTNKLIIKGKNEITTIDAVVANDTLVIKNNKKLSLNLEKNTLELHFSNLGYLVTYNPVTLTTKDTIRADKFIFGGIGEIAEVRLVVDCNYLLVVNSANTLGYFHLSGKAVSCSFFNRYGSAIYADSLSCKNADITNESVGDIYVNASAIIKASIWGPGNIYYYGNPVVTLSEKRGTGSILRAR